MATLPQFFKLLSQNPLSPFLKNGNTTSHILQIHSQSLTNPAFSHPSTPISLLFFLSKLPNPSPPPSYTNLIFSAIRYPDTFAYNTIIRLHSKASNPTHSIQFFVQMKRNGVRTDNYTYPFALKACNLLSDAKLAGVIHGEVLKLGYGADLFVANNLISCYCRGGEVVLAREVFDGVLCRDLVSWNSMMSGYVEFGYLREARELFDEMPHRDAFSWAVLIDGYGKRGGDVVRARELFDIAGVKDLVCWNSMIDGYSSVCDMDSARELFDRMPQRNVISWSIMIDGYVRYGSPREALELFQRMLDQRTNPDRVSAVGAITACAQLGALDQGRWIHSYLKRKRINFDVVVETSLVDMYMKCGSLDLARRLFEGMRKKNVVSWNVMIVGLGTNGCGVEAVGVFNRMVKEGAPMDDLTLVGVLSACTHGGLVKEGLDIFDRMSDEFGIDPKVEHYGCVVDLLGRAGRLDEARELIERMPMDPTPALWGSLIAACRTHLNIDLAEFAFDQLVRLGADDSGVYVLMSNIYAAGGRWARVWKMREAMGERGMQKETGTSAIEVEGNVHEFVNGGGDHMPCSKMEVYRVLQILSNGMVS